MFEPSSLIYSAAKTNLQNHNIKVNNLAVGDKVGQRKFFIYGTSAISSFYKNDDFYTNQIEIVDTITVDKYCFSHKINLIDYLKIDTEGHDLYVLKGAEKMLDSKKINFIQFEYGPSNIYSNVLLKDILNFLISKNYFVFRIYPSFIRPVVQYSSELENFVLVNYISVSSKVIDKVESYIKE
tara:strand:+ start:1808 stop:2353 length:546 start_codon:yes stop_codon:yes gene_type:complete